MIITNPWLTNIPQTHTRKFVVENTRIIKIILFRFPVVKYVTVDPEVIILHKATLNNWIPELNIIISLFTWAGTSKETENFDVIIHDHDKWRAKEGGVIIIFLSEKETSLSEKYLVLRFD